MKIMLDQIRLWWMKVLIWIMEKAVAVHFSSVHQHRRNFGVPKSSPRGPQWSQVFCPTRQKSLPSRNQRSQVKVMSAWWGRKTGHLWYTSGIPEGGIFHFQCGRCPLFACTAGDYWEKRTSQSLYLHAHLLCQRCLGALIFLLCWFLGMWTANSVFTESRRSSAAWI